MTIAVPFVPIYLGANTWAVVNARAIHIKRTIAKPSFPTFPRPVPPF
jgi:hypothetical protein